MFWPCQFCHYNYYCLQIAVFVLMFTCQATAYTSLVVITIGQSFCFSRFAAIITVMPMAPFFSPDSTLPAALATGDPVIVGKEPYLY